MEFQPDKPIIIKALKSFPQLKILVLGDIMLDRFIWGEVRRISPEAPVPVVSVTKETDMLGGAGNVLRNLRTLGADALVCSVIGADEFGRQVCSQVESIGVAAEGLVISASHCTTVKTRVVAHSQQVVRVDREDKSPFSPFITEQLTHYLRQVLPIMNAVIVSDYAKGVITAEVLQPVMQEASIGKIITVDPKVENIKLFRKATIVTPNHLEAAQAAGLSLDQPDYLEKSARKLLQELESQAILITRGEQGMNLFTANSQVHLPAIAKQVYDVTGAGDTVISTLTLGLAAGLNMREAAWLANRAAGIVVGQVGTSAVTSEELLSSVDY